MALKITKDNFDEKVLKNEKPVLVDFWASWCGPCQMLSPVIEKLAEENDFFVVGKVNVDEEMELAMRYKINAIPSLIVFKNGEAVAQQVGFISEEQILNMFK